MSYHKKKKKWPIVLLVIIIIIVVLGVVGYKFFKHEVAQVAAKQMIKQQVQESGNAQANDILNSMSEEDLDTATQIAEKYVSVGKLNEYMTAYKNGNLSQIKSDLKESMTQEDLNTLKALYEKYK